MKKNFNILHTIINTINQIMSQLCYNFTQLSRSFAIVHLFYFNEVYTIVVLLKVLIDLKIF